MFEKRYRHASIPLVSPRLPRCAVSPSIDLLVVASSREIYRNCQSKNRDNNPFDV